MIPIRGVVTTTSRRRRAVVDDADVAGGAHVGARVAQVDAERLAQLAGPVGELPAAVAPLGHHVEAVERQHGAQQHSLAVAVADR